MRKVFHGIVLALIACSSLYAATWDEPWHRDVVLKAEAFGLYEVVTSSAARVALREIRHLAGIQTGPNIEIDGFYAGELLSSSSVNGRSTGESTLMFKGPGTRYYLFLKKAPDGSRWRIASPTAGFAEVGADAKVVATFRISIHQAAVDSNTYELTQICIYKKLHGEECSADLYRYIVTQLSLEPPVMSATASPEQVDRFYNQHAALETSYLIGYSVDRDTLSKFLRDPGFHTQISAVRALRSSDSRERNAMLMAFVTDDTRSLLARVVAAQMIREADARELMGSITAYIPKASTEEVGLGMNIMDPRIGTRFPESLKQALEKLVADWK